MLFGLNEINIHMTLINNFDTIVFKYSLYKFTTQIYITEIISEIVILKMLIFSLEKILMNNNIKKFTMKFSIIIYSIYCCNLFTN